MMEVTEQSKCERWKTSRPLPCASSILRRRRRSSGSPSINTIAKRGKSTTIGLGREELQPLAWEAGEHAGWEESDDDAENS